MSIKQNNKGITIYKPFNKTRKESQLGRSVNVFLLGTTYLKTTLHKAIIIILFTKDLNISDKSFMFKIKLL